MNKTLGTLVHDGRLHLASAIVADRMGSENEEGHPVSESRRPMLNTLRRRAGLVAAIALGGTILVGIAALSVPPSYTATAQLIVDPTPGEVAGALLGPVIDTHIATLTSNRRLRQVLTERAESPVAAPQTEPPNFAVGLRETLSTTVAAIKEALLPARPPSDAQVDGSPPLELGPLKDSLLVRQERLSSIVAVSARSTNPGEAAATVNRLVTLHVDELRDRKRRDADTSRSEQDVRIAAARTSLERSEDALKAFQATNGLAAPDDATDLIQEVQRQLALARTELREREARLAREDDAPLDGAGTDVAAASRRERVELEYAVRDLGFRISRLELRLQELQNRSSLAFQQRLEQQDLESRVASGRKLLDDLRVRRQEEPKDATRPFAAEARIFALASVPSLPSSINPLLLLPPAFVAFGVLGAALALLRERMDRSLRTEREVEEIAGIGCLGCMPSAKPGTLLHPPARWRDRAALRERSVDSLARSLARLCDSKHGTRIIFVTAGRHEEDKQGLARMLGDGLTRTGHRVLVIETDDRKVSSLSRGDTGDATDMRKSPSERIAVPLDQIDKLLNRHGDDFKHLAGLYNYLLVDAPPLLNAMQLRVLAAKADGVILGLRWGVTRRETIAETLQSLRRSARLVGESEISVFAVLTEVDPQRYARFLSKTT